jgi:hypothetical protein
MLAKIFYTHTYKNQVLQQFLGFIILKTIIKFVKYGLRIFAGYLVWLFGYSWQGYGNSSNAPSWRMRRSLLCCLSFETWLLPKGDKGRETE